MIAEARGAELYRQWHAYIDDEQTKDAFSYIVGLAAALPDHNCYPKTKGEVQDFRFEDKEKEVPFAFIVTKAWLLFYFRIPAVRSGTYSLSDVQAAFDSTKENPKGEWTVKLRSIADVKRLWTVLAISKSG